jgi:hypothetical protein
VLPSGQVFYTDCCPPGCPLGLRPSIASERCQVWARRGTLRPRAFLGKDLRAMPLAKSDNGMARPCSAANLLDCGWEA